MASISIYIDDVRHDISSPTNLYHREALVIAMQQYLDSHDIPLEIIHIESDDYIPGYDYGGSVPPPVIGSGGGFGNDGGGFGNDGNGLDSVHYFRVKRAPHPSKRVGTVAVYGRQISSNYPWNASCDVNSIAMGQMYVDLNNPFNNIASAAKTPPQDWLDLNDPGSWMEDHPVVPVNGYFASGATSQSFDINLPTDHGYFHDPRMSCAFVRITVDVVKRYEIIISTPGAGFLNDQRSIWFGPRVLRLPQGTPPGIITPTDVTSLGSSSGVVIMEPGYEYYFLMTDFNINSYPWDDNFQLPNPNRNGRVEFVIYVRPWYVTSSINHAPSSLGYASNHTFEISPWSLTYWVEDDHEENNAIYVNIAAEMEIDRLYALEALSNPAYLSTVHIWTGPGGLAAVDHMTEIQPDYNGSIFVFIPKGHRCVLHVKSTHSSWINFRLYTYGRWIQGSMWGYAVGSGNWMSTGGYGIVAHDHRGRDTTVFVNNLVRGIDFDLTLDYTGASSVNLQITWSESNELVGDVSLDIYRSDHVIAYLTGESSVLSPVFNIPSLQNGVPYQTGPILHDKFLAMFRFSSEEDIDKSNSVTVNFV